MADPVGVKMLADLRAMLDAMPRLEVVVAESDVAMLTERTRKDGVLHVGGFAVKAIDSCPPGVGFLVEYRDGQPNLVGVLDLGEKP